MQHWIVQVGSHAPFGQASTLLETLTGIVLSESTIQRWTEAIGREALAVEDEAAAQLHHALPEPTEHPAQVAVSADGAMVPLVHGIYGEMKLLVVGIPTATETGVHLTEMTYVARISDAATFTQQCYPEVHRRGVDGAKQVALISDGADWIQHLMDAYRPDATRILDAMHACQRLNTISQLLFPTDVPLATRWYQRMRERLLAGNIATVLVRLRRWQERCPAIAGDVEYLAKRVAMMVYDHGRAQGWPMGSGSVESGNRHLMQARLKGAGMHWAIPNANAVLALRCLEKNHRWASTLPILLERHRVANGRRRREKQHLRHPAVLPDPLSVGVLPPIEPAPPPPPRLVLPPYSWNDPFLPRKRVTASVNR